MKVLDLEKQWLEANTNEHEIDLKVTLKTYGDCWDDYESFLKEIQQVAESYGFKLDEL